MSIKYTTLAHLKQLAQIVKANDDALGVRIDEHIAAIEAAGYQNASQVSAAVNAAITALNIGQYALDADLETLENKVEGLVTAGGEPNVIETVKVNGTALTVTDKAVDVPVPEYTIVKAADSGDYAAVYNLTKGGTIVGASINIPKDMVVKSGSVVGENIVLVLNDEAGTEIKIPVGSLIEYVTSGSATGDMVVVTVSDDHKVTATITDGTVTLAKLTSEVQAKINQAHEHSNKTVLDGITSAKVAAWDAAEGNAKTYADGVATTAESNAKTYADGLNSAMDTRVEAVEDAKHTHSNKTVLDGITSTKVSNWDAAEGNAKDYADGLNTAMDSRVQVVEGKAHEHSNKALLDTYTQTEANLADAVSKKHSHSNKTVLDGITAAKVSAWDAAESNAKAYADGLADNYDEAGAADQALTDAKAYADGLAGNYDAKGAAATAKTEAVAEAKAYTDAMVAADADVTAMLNEVFGE